MGGDGCIKAFQTALYGTSQLKLTMSAQPISMCRVTNACIHPRYSLPSSSSGRYSTSSVSQSCVVLGKEKGLLMRCPALLFCMALTHTAFLVFCYSSSAFSLSTIAAAFALRLASAACFFVFFLTTGAPCIIFSREAASATSSSAVFVFAAVSMAATPSSLHMQPS